MQAQIRLGLIFGIEIGLHYSWLIIAVLIATSLTGHFSEAHPGWEATMSRSDFVSVAGLEKSAFQPRLSKSSHSVNISLGAVFAL